MRTMYKFFGIIALVAVAGFLMTACTDPTSPAGDSAQKAADAFKAAHAAILGKTVDTVAIADEAAVNAALTAYNQLPNNVKALLSAQKTLLDQLSQKIEQLKTASGGQAEAEAFKTAHAEILAKAVDSLALTDSAAVHTALTAYSELSDNAKVLLAAEKAKLDQQLAKITELEEGATPQELADAFKTGYAEILALTVGTVTLAHKAGIEAALEEYERYNNEVTALLTTEKTTLDVLIAQIELLEKVAEFKADHADILGKTVVTVMVADETNLNAALSAYNELPNNVKALLSAEKTLLDSLQARITELKVSSVAINKSETELWIADGMTAGSVAETLSATVTLVSEDVDPSDTVSWTSSDPSVATVDPSTGKVTAVTAGKTTITVTTQGHMIDGESATDTCEVTVSTAAMPTAATADLPVIDSLDGGWYAPGNGERQTAPFPFSVGDSGAYFTETWAWGDPAPSPYPSITDRGFDSTDKAEGEASLKMTFDLTSYIHYCEATLGIGYSPVNFTGYHFLTFRTKATVAGRYDVTIRTSEGNRKFPFTASGEWEQVIIHAIISTDVIGFFFQATNDPGYANEAAGSRTGSLWIDDIRLAAEGGAHFEDNGYAAHTDNYGSGHQGWIFSDKPDGWTRYQAADTEDKKGSWIFNSSIAADPPSAAHPYPGTEVISLTVGGGVWNDYLMASGLDKPGDIFAIDPNMDWTSTSDIAYVKFQDINTAAGDHQVTIFTNGNDDKFILVKLNDNPAVIVSLPSVEGNHNWQCIFAKQLVLGPFKGDGQDVLWVSGTIGDGWANIFHIDVKDDAEN